MAIRKEGNALGIVGDFVEGTLDGFRRDNNEPGFKTPSQLVQEGTRHVPRESALVQGCCGLRNLALS